MIWTASLAYITSIERKGKVIAMKINANETLQQYGTNPELDKLVDSDRVEDRMEAAAQRYALEKLKNDKSEKVRATVAARGYALESLMYDPSDEVRIEVIYQGYNLDWFICRDKSCFIRDTANYVKSLLEQKAIA